MTPRFWLLFFLVCLLTVLGEWFGFFRGFNWGGMSTTNWLILLFVMAAEAAAVGVVVYAVDVALPAPGGRAFTKDKRHSRRGKQSY